MPCKFLHVNSDKIKGQSALHVCKNLIWLLKVLPVVLYGLSLLGNGLLRFPMSSSLPQRLTLLYFFILYVWSSLDNLAMGPSPWGHNKVGPKTKCLSCPCQEPWPYRGLPFCWTKEIKRN